MNPRETGEVFLEMAVSWGERGSAAITSSLWRLAEIGLRGVEAAGRSGPKRAGYQNRGVWSNSIWGKRFKHT